MSPFDALDNNAPDEVLDLELDIGFEDEADQAQDDLGEELDDEGDPGLGPRCAGCGCTSDNGCDGGCVWATPTRCSRCV